MISPVVKSKPKVSWFRRNASCVPPEPPAIRRSSEMPKTKEFSIRMEDEPGALGKICRTLADAKVNILAFQSIPWEKTSLVRFVVDNPTTAKSILDTQKLKYTEAEVAQVRLPHRPGELARAASQLGEAEININYAYCGI